MTTTVFVPTWRDRAGNSLFFMARNHIFDDATDACEWQVAHALDYMVPWGLAPAGVKPIDIPDDGNIPMRHVVGSSPMLGKSVIFSGPALGEEASS